MSLATIQRMGFGAMTTMNEWPTDLRVREWP
jgi:hypothetical protein